MWDKILAFLGFLLSGLAAIKNALEAAFRWLASHMLFGIFGAVGVVAYVYSWIMGKLNAGIQSISAMCHSAPGQDSVNAGLAAVMSWIEKVNVILPVDAILSAVITYLAFAAGWALYKTIKSWIPTLSGS